VITAAAAVDLAAHDPIKTRVTWTSDIARIISARCATCHHPGAPDTMSLATYEEARPWARAIKEEVITRRMPVWHAVRGYGDFSNDPSLSAFDIALVSAWADGGAPKGTPADAVKSSTAVSPWTPAALTFPAGAREVTVACGERPVPAGTLLAIRPDLTKGSSVGVATKRPDGRVDIVGWIRDYDPRYPWTYRLRVPIALAPQTVIIAQPPAPGCSVTLTVLTP
jgi:hypothetical protein